MTVKVCLVEDRDLVRGAPLSEPRFELLRTYLQSGSPIIFIIDRDSIAALVAEIDRLRGALAEKEWRA